MYYYAKYAMFCNRIFTSGYKFILTYIVFYAVLNIIPVMYKLSIAMPMCKTSCNAIL
jgi:hypothetical protein